MLAKNTSSFLREYYAKNNYKMKNNMLPPISLFYKHIFRLTDEKGILEHCLFSVPDLTEGYCLDDNARALQLTLRLPEKDNKFKSLSQVYLKFILSAKTKNGFHNDLNQNYEWKNDDDSKSEAFGRAMAALGETASSSEDEGTKLAAAFTFDQQFLLTAPDLSLRTCSQLIFGAAERIKFEKNFPQLLEKLELRKRLKGENWPKINFEKKLEKLADSLINKYKKNASEKWKWYEDYLTYDNGRLPSGLFTAYSVTHKEAYKKIAKESLDFLLEKTYDFERDCFSFPGYRGWYSKSGERNFFGQQPIEAGSTAEACELAYSVLKEKKYLDYLEKSIFWFTGKNIINTSLLNTKTGGVYDGIEEYGLNPNQGAESNICFIMAYLSAKRMNL